MADAQEMELPPAAADEPASCTSHEGEQRRAHTAVNVARLVSSLERTLQQAKEEESRRDPSPTIHRVRPGIRKEHPRAYEPKVVSLGPFHGGKPGLEEMEKLKRRFMNNLLDRSPENSVTKYVAAVLRCETARARYAGELWPTLSPWRRRRRPEAAPGADEFVEVMVLDGCFLVECLVKSGKGELGPALAAANCNTTLLRNDCLLIENQVPFCVVKALFHASVIPWPGRQSPPPTLWLLATHLLKIKNPPAPPAPATDEAYHLLHVYHRSLNPGPSPSPPPKSCRQTVTHYLGKLNLISPIFYGALYSLLNCQWPQLSHSVSQNSSSKYPRMIPCATELREAGIRIKKQPFAGSDDHHSFLAVSFSNGTLQIPFLSVEEATNSRFRNLVAFEQCCPGVGSYFTSYAIFMDNIVNTAADVAVLRSCGVVESKLGSDEEVAHMFNTVCKGSHLNFEEHYLREVFREVRKYCEESRHRWRAKLMHDYFSSPWALISVVVASILLIFTGLQAVFAVVAYFRPPKQP